MTPRPILDPGTLGKVRAQKTSDALARAKRQPEGEREAAVARAKLWMERGAWVADARHRDHFGSTRQIRRFGRTQAEALAALNEEVAHRNRAGGTTLDAARTVDDLVTWWLEEMLPLKDVREQSRQKDAQIAAFLTKRVGGLRLYEVTAPRAQHLLDTLAREGLLDRPKKVRNLAGQIWHDAQMRRAVPDNPWRETKTPRRKVVRTKDRALGDTDLIAVRRQVAEWISPSDAEKKRRGGPKPGKHLLAAIDTMVVTGLRIGEVLALRKRDVLIREDGFAELDVTGTIVPDGSSQKRQEQPKTEFSEARVPAAPHVAAQLIALGEGKADDELLFQSRTGRPVSPNQIATQLRRALEGTEWVGKVSPHAFRASIGTWVAAKLGDEKAREFLRHTSVETTRKHHLRRDAPLVDPTISQAIAAGLLLSAEAEAWAEAANRVVRAPDPEGLGGFHARSAADKAGAGSNDPVWDDDLETF